MPAVMLAGAPSIATLAIFAASPTSTETVATAGLVGNGLVGSAAENVNESAPA